jgi:sigma-54 dependent transcriptional regulator
LIRWRRGPALKDCHPVSTSRLLTLPPPSASPLSVRAKALLFEDPLSLRLLQEMERLARSDAT